MKVVMFTSIRSQSIAFVTLLIAVSVGVVSVVQIQGLVSALDKTSETVLGLTNQLSEVANDTAESFKVGMVSTLEENSTLSVSAVNEMSTDLLASVEGQFEARLEVIETLAPSALGSAIWNYDTDTIDQVLAGLTQMNSVEVVEIIEASGSSLASAGDAQGKKLSSRDVPLSFDGNDLGILRVQYSTEALETGKARVSERLTGLEDGLRVAASAAVQAAEESGKDQASLIKQVEGDAVAEISQLSSEAQSSASVTALAIAFVAILLATAAVYFVMTAILFRPLKTIEARMASLAGGELDADVPFRGRRNEVGAMADALEIFKSNAHEKVELEARQLRNAEEAERQKREATLELASDFEASVGKIVESVSSASRELNSVAKSMLSTSTTTNDLSSSASDAAGQAADSVNSVAAAAEELSVSLTSTSTNMTDQTKAADDAANLVEESSTQIQGLVQKAEQIGGVVEMITAIAEKTNLLALNATIESARAGEAGKGFAVVATEVKALATQTASATESIVQEIAGIQEQTSSAVQAFDLITSQISNIKSISTSVAGMIEEQSSTAIEIGRTTQNAADGTQRVSDSVVDVAHATAQTGESAEEVLAAAQRLSQGSSELKSAVDNFLGRVRAA